MLRITRITDRPPGVTLKVEGRIASDWVDEFVGVCRDALTEARAVSLDFAAVTYVDRRGTAALRALTGAHVRIINCPALIADLLAPDCPESTGC